MDEKNGFDQLALSGQLYDSADPIMLGFQGTACNLLKKYNKTKDTPRGLAKRDKILKKAVGTYGEGLCILPPIYCNFGLRHVHFGNEVFVNYCCNFVDDGEIYIGDYTMVGPSVIFATACHPISPTLRKHKIQYNKPIHVGKNVWIGSGAIILPGVTIGDNAIIGAGAVVTKDVAANTIAVGNPARKLRDITDRDYEFFDGNKIPKSILKKYR